MSKNPSPKCREAATEALNESAQLTRAKKFSKRKSKKFDPIKDPILAKIEDFNGLLPTQNIKNAPKLAKGGIGSYDIAEQYRLDIRLEELVLQQGDTNSYELARQLGVSYDRVRSSYKRVCARWQVTGSTIQDIETVKGERLASVKQKIKHYTALLDMCFTDIALAWQEENELNLNVPSERQQAELAMNRRYKAISVAVRLLNSMYKWERLHCDLIGAFSSGNTRDRTYTAAEANRSTLTPDEIIALGKIDHKLVAVMKRYLDDRKV